MELKQGSLINDEGDPVDHEFDAARKAIANDELAVTPMIRSSRQLITHSRMNSFKSCRRRHWFEYEVGMRRLVDSRALRMGSAWHEGLHVLKVSDSLDDAVAIVRASYENLPEGIEQYGWNIECETVCTLLSGYQWRWQESKLEIIASEQPFYLPLKNPETGKATTSFDLAGKIDGVIKMPDGRLAVLEHKTISDSVLPDSDWWRRLQVDPQVTLYVHAARELGYDVSTVLYDVVRKPTIGPTAVSLVDGDGVKIVLDKDGKRVKNKNGAWRQTASTDDGYVLQTRPMTVSEWSSKMCIDIGERPEFYYARVEVPRLDQDISECMSEVWDIQQAVREAQRNDRWYRTVSKDTCSYCPFLGPCYMKFNPDTGLLPEGFHYVEDKHSELS
jgi:hypothetical protein